MSNSNPMEYLRDLAIKRVLEIVVQLPNIQAYPTIAQELTSISDSVAIQGDLT